MKITTTYMMRKMGHMLKSKDAWIVGKCCDGDRWPEGNHYWIIYTITGDTHHVMVCDRPSWSRYKKSL
jgi:hypothetical protein